jgi:pyridoxal phosphate phosphatase PHOSPHO2
MLFQARYVPSQFLGDKATTEKYRNGMKPENYGPTHWHECVSAVIACCLQDSNCSTEELIEAASSMPFLIDVKGALDDVHSNKESKVCGQAIISDGNDLFIHAFLKKNEMQEYFTHGVETNTAVWETVPTANGCESGEMKYERLKITYQSAKFGGHTCKTCPPNLCKSQALSDILSRITAQPNDNNNRPRIVYIGDGSNDACPALRVLQENDILLARCGKRRRDPNSLSGPTADVDSVEGHGRHDFHPEMHLDEIEVHVAGTFPILSTLRKAKNNSGLETKCRVYAWRSGRQLRSLVGQILDGTLMKKRKMTL